MPEVTDEVEVTMEVKCPECEHTWEETQDCEVTVSFDFSDYAPDAYKKKLRSCRRCGRTISKKQAIEFEDLCDKCFQEQ